METKPIDSNVVVAATPNTVPVVPSDWAALGMESGYNPRPAESLRLWVIGPNGEGKTTFVASIPDQIILDHENGANAIVGARSVRVHIKNYDHYVAVTDKLLADAKAGKRRWKRIAVDTADEWIGMIVTQLQKEKNVEDITEFGSQGKGYNLIQNRGWSKIRELEGAGYTWTIVGHQRLREETNPATHQKTSRLRPSIYPGFARQIQGCSDFELTIYSLTEQIQKTKEQKLPNGQIITTPDGTIESARYYLSALNTAEKEGKTRGVPSMERKFEIPLVNAWDVFTAKYGAATKAAKEKYQS